MNTEALLRAALITLYMLFSIIRIRYYRKARRANYKTVIEEKQRYAIWLSVLICYEVFTFLMYIAFPQTLAWAALPLPIWARFVGIALGMVALAWFLWIHRALGTNLSARIRIKVGGTCRAK